MQKLVESEVRASFGGCSAGERKRMRIPDLTTMPWSEMDFLSWIDRSDAMTGYVVVWHESHATGFIMRAQVSGGNAVHSSMCNWCRTVHTQGGVRLFTTPTWDDGGKNGNTIGDYICSDLACSLYLRGIKTSDSVQLPTHKSIRLRSTELRDRITQFVHRATGH